MVRPEGIEPPAYRFEACRSIHLSYGRTPVECSVPNVRRETKKACGKIRVCAGRDPAVVMPSLPQRGPVAQLAEQQTLNLRVDGSIPSRLTRFSSDLASVLASVSV